jgi:hypothetical protein
MPLPVDTEMMRVTTARLLADDAEPPNPDQLKTLTLQLRGHIDQLVPEVEQVAGRLSKDEIRRYCALACVGEARMKLGLTPLPGTSAGIAHARRLSRVVRALCDHLENLGGDRS